MRSTRSRRSRWYSGAICGLVCALALVASSCRSPAVVVIPPPCPVMSEAGVYEMNWNPYDKPFLELWISEIERFCNSLDRTIERFAP